MSKFKLILIGFVLVFIAAAIVRGELEHKWRVSAEKDRDRYYDNWRSTSEDNKDLREINAKYKELPKKYKRLIDSLAKEFNTKPKQVSQIVMSIHTELILTPTWVNIKPIEKNVWEINDTISKCAFYKARAFLDGENLKLKRIEFRYENTTVEIHFWKHKFLFFGKKYFQELKSDCGETKVEEINIIKK